MSTTYQLGPNREHSVTVDLDQFGCRVRLTVDGQVRLDRQVRDRLEHTFYVADEPNPLHLRVAFEQMRLRADLYRDGSALTPTSRVAEPAAASQSSAPPASPPPSTEPPSAPQPPPMARPTFAPAAAYRRASRRRRGSDFGNAAIYVCWAESLLCLWLLWASREPGPIPFKVVFGFAAAIWAVLGVGVALGFEFCAWIASALNGLGVLLSLLQLALLLLMGPGWLPDYLVPVPYLVVTAELLLSLLLFGLCVRGILRIREEF